MPKVPEGIDSAFRHILVAARRAEQLINGARPRIQSRHVKPTTIALAEMQEGEVPWRIVSPEEYEALRQQELAPEASEDETTVFVRPEAAGAAAKDDVQEPAEEDETFEEDFEEPGFSDEDLEDVDDDDLLGGDDDEQEEEGGEDD